MGYVFWNEITDARSIIILSLPSMTIWISIKYSVVKTSYQIHIFVSHLYQIHGFVSHLMGVCRPLGRLHHLSPRKLQIIIYKNQTTFIVLLSITTQRSTPSSLFSPQSQLHSTLQPKDSQIITYDGTIYLRFPFKPLAS